MQSKIKTLEYANLALEVAMDLFNNIGYIVGDGASLFISDHSLSNLIWNAFKNGELKFLDPLGQISPQDYGMICTTILVPTS